MKMQCEKCKESKLDFFYKNTVTLTVAILGVLSALLLLGIALVQKNIGTSIFAGILLLVCADAVARGIAVRKK